MGGGWIGSWSPGIGDPTVVGWVTVLLYAWAAWRCHRVLQKNRAQRLALSGNETLIWRLLVAGLIALGINKQLDLQTALTEAARLLAHEQGWYEQRRQYQEAFIAACIVMGVTAMAAMAVLTWNAPAATLWACAGAAGLLTFVLVRASSFHHVDEALGWQLGGLRLNGILEMGSLCLIGRAARKRTRVRT
jgi:hypothetical protein